MTVYTVTCHTPDNNDADRRMQGIGGTIGFTRWWHTVDQVIRNIEQIGDDYYVGTGIMRVRVLVRTHPTSRRKYITTDPDGRRGNNLLNLPHCPR